MSKEKSNELSAIREKLKASLKKSRYEHTIGVEFTGAALAMKYGADIHRVRIAGLLHDCAKNISDKEQLIKCKEFCIPISETEEKNPYLLHGKLGAYMARVNYGILDQQVLDAIKYHTTGRINMTIMEKIIFTADYIEPSRDKAPGLEQIRQMAFEDIDRAMIMIFEDTMEYIRSSGNQLDMTTKDAYDYLVSHMNISNKN